MLKNNYYKTTINGFCVFVTQKQNFRIVDIEINA